MAGYPVVGVSESCVHDPQGVDVLNVDGSVTHYDVGDTVPLSKLLSRRYSWLVERGYLSESETGFGSGGAATWGSISGTLSSQTDLQTALNGKLDLTGGTLTGLLGITSGANTFNFKNGGSSTTPYLHVGTSPGKSIALLAGSNGAGIIYQNDASFTIGVDTRANLDAGTSSGGTSFLTMSSTGATTLTGDLTISKGAPAITLASAAGNSTIYAQSPAGSSSNIWLMTGTSRRWTIIKNTTAESGSNAGSDLVITRADDNGNYLADALTITRSTGAVSLTGDLTISKATATHTITSSSGISSLSLNTVAGTAGAIRFRTGTSQRWVIQKNGTAESGSNAGSDLEFVALTDAGGTLSTPLTITRSTGAVALSNNLSVGGYIDLPTTQINSDLKTINVTTAFLLDSFSASLYRSAEYTIQLSQGTNYAQCKILVIHNGTDVAITEYGFAEIGTTIPFEFSTNFSLGVLEILMTCSNANTTAVGVKFSRLLYDA